MPKFFTAVWLTLTLATSFGQSNRKISTYLLAQYTNTIYDETIGNNPWGAGLGLQAILNNKTKFKPTIELSADVYLEDDKTSTLVNGVLLETVDGMINIFGGSLFQPTNNLFISVLAGPSFIGDHVFFGIKPSIGVLFSKIKDGWENYHTLIFTTGKK